MIAVQNMTQFLRHVKSPVHVADLAVMTFGHTIYGCQSFNILGVRKGPQSQKSPTDKTKNKLIETKEKAKTKKARPKKRQTRPRLNRVQLKSIYLW